MSLKRTAKNMPRGNRAIHQSLTQIETDVDAFKNTIGEVSRGTSTDVPAELTWDRARDHVRPLPTPDANRNVYSVEDMHAISSGGVVDHQTKMPTLPNSGNRW